MSVLSRNYRVIAFDNRGAGRTKPQDVETSIPQIPDGGRYDIENSVFHDRETFRIMNFLAMFL